MATCPRRWALADPGRIALVLASVAGLAACAGTAGSSLGASDFVLTSSGGYVLSDAAPGIEVTLGSKQVRPAREVRDPEQ